MKQCPNQITISPRQCGKMLESIRRFRQALKNNERSIMIHKDYVILDMYSYTELRAVVEKAEALCKTAKCVDSNSLIFEIGYGTLNNLQQAIAALKETK